MSLKVIDLFAGCGGFSLGCQQAGFKILVGFDNWESAISVYRDNFDHPIINLDLSQPLDTNLFKNYDPDMIIGGSPCQDFSSAGKRNEQLGRGNLTLSLAKIVSEVKPEWFIIENVERIEKSSIVSSVLELLQLSGYGLTKIILNASYCHVPQSRKRYFLIGKLGEKEQFLESILIKNLSQKPMTVFDYLGNSLGIEYYYRHPRSYKRRGVFSIYEPSPTIRGVNRPIPKNYEFHRGDACTIFDKIRPLTTLERSYLQTFPKTFKFSGTKTDLEHMIANAVPVNLAKYVAMAIREY